MQEEQKPKFNKKEFLKIRYAIYEIADTLLILKTYCEHNKECNKCIIYINELVNKIEKNFNIISAKF